MRKWEKVKDKVYKIIDEAESSIDQCLLTACCPRNVEVINEATKRSTKAGMPQINTILFFSLPCLLIQNITNIKIKVLQSMLVCFQLRLIKHTYKDSAHVSNLFYPLLRSPEHSHFLCIISVPPTPLSNPRTDKVGTALPPGKPVQGHENLE